MRRRIALRWWVLGAALTASAAAIGIAAVVEVPYYTISPGSVWPTAELVSVDGDVEVFESEGEIGFTTISLDHASALEAFLGWLDPSVQVLTEREALGDSTRQQSRQVNLQYMADSKTQATAVALESLGYEVTIQGTGAQVLQVEEEMPAADALEPGDVIVEAGGAPVLTWDDLVAVLGGFEPGDELPMQVERVATGEVEAISVVLGARDDDPALPLLGVVGQTRGVYEFPFDVEIDTGEVGGPSAGLAFTLTIIDVLTPDDLTGGRLVAVTGAINADGTVAPVGGVAQKVIAARRAGAEAFIVPSVEYDEAASVAGDLPIEKADTVDEALAVLESLGDDVPGLASAGDDSD